MPFPITFAQLAAGIEPLALFDTMFNVVGGMGTVFCTATGTNTVVLAPNTNMPAIASYGNYNAYGFVAVNTTTGSVTLNVGSVGAKPAYANDGVTQLGAGSLVAGVYYVFAYNVALNSAAGGFQIISTTSALIIGSQGLETKFTSTGTFTTPANSAAATIYRYRMVGAGGGSGGAGVTASFSAPGGAGAYAEGTFTGVAASTAIAVTIGAGGVAGVASGGGTGGTGGSTSLGTPVSVTCTGGIGGVGGNTSASSSELGGAGGTISVGSPSIAIPGQYGNSSIAISSSFILAGNGGSTMLGQGGVGAAGAGSNQSSSAPLGYGSGAGGVISSSGATIGTPGAQGFVIIEQMTP